MVDKSELGYNGCRDTDHSNVRLAPISGNYWLWVPLAIAVPTLGQWFFLANRDGLSDCSGYL